MKKIITFLAAALLISGGVAAQTKTKGGKKSTQENLAKETKYRLVIEFISKGAGLDQKAHETILKHIEKHPKHPKFDKFTWGREGEVDYCLHLKELTAAEQKTFVAEIEKMIDDKTMVSVKENFGYVKKGR
jgi:hypothetical protein